MIGTFRERASDFANDTPTTNEPISPGPRVHAIASISLMGILATERASLTTGMIFS